jgi:hypothetical protein
VPGPEQRPRPDEDKVREALREHDEGGEEPSEDDDDEEDSD